jgi:hypothetical protein
MVRKIMNVFGRLVLNDMTASVGFLHRFCFPSVGAGYITTANATK